MILYFWVISMIYKVGMLCKHFKGTDLYEKNIYKIIQIGVDGIDLPSDVKYSGDNDVSTATNLVIYANIFQDNMLFAREYEDISSYLSADKKEKFSQEIKVQPLSEKEIEIISDEDFKRKKEELTKNKFSDNKKK